MSSRISSVSSRSVPLYGGKGDVPDKSEQVRKTSDDALHELEHLIERFNQRLTLDNLRLVERYLKFELHILLEFKVRGLDIDFIAHFQRFRGTTKISPAYQPHHGSDVNLRIADCHSGVVIESHGTELVPCNRSEQKAVFVDVVKFVEMPERVVPASVWFERDLPSKNSAN